MEAVTLLKSLSSCGRISAQIQRERKKKLANFTKQTAPILILSAGTLWGTMGIFVRKLSAFQFTSIQIAALRIVVGSVILLAVTAALNRDKLKIRLRDAGWFLAMGLCSILLFTICYFQAISLASLSVAAILLYTAPIMVMLMSLVLFHEKMTKRKFLALLMAFLGCVLVSGIGRDSRISAAAIGFGLASAFGYGLYSILGTFVLRRYHPITVTTYSFLCAGIGALLISHPTDILRKIQAAQNPANVVLLIFLTAIVTAVLPYLAYTIGLSFVKASSSSIMASIEPVVATIAGFVIFQEKLTVFSLIGIALVIAAILTLNLQSDVC